MKRFSHRPARAKPPASRTTMQKQQETSTGKYIVHRQVLIDEMLQATQHSMSVQKTFERTCRTCDYPVYKTDPDPRMQSLIWTGLALRGNTGL